jgi:hypothetical protein
MKKRSKNKKKQAVGFISGNPYRQLLLIKSNSKEEMEGGGKKPSLSLPGLTVPAYTFLQSVPLWEALRSIIYGSILPNYNINIQ